MSCLALSLQPANGSDILLQTREWFPPARALAAISLFRQARLSSEPDPLLSLGDDPLAASAGQLTVGVESRYRVIYRLVNSVYVLGIAPLDSPNIFGCINTVNQAVSVLVAACRGVDVTPEKLHRKYPEIYMALDIVLRGVGSVRLSTILSSIHGDSIAKMVHTAVESENRVRGADTWSASADAATAERQSTLSSFADTTFELPAETLSAGDEFAAATAPPSSSAEEQQLKDEAANQEQSSQEEKDPFAASEKLNKPEEALVGGFKKAKESDPAAALAGLDVSSLPRAEATKPTFVGVEGFEGEYGGIEFGKEESLSEAFEGFDNAFGGGLDASEFVNTNKKVPKPEGLGGLEFLTSGGVAPATAEKKDGPTPLENLLVEKKKEMTVPEMYISEEINAEFRESLLSRVAFKGTIFLRTLPPKQAAGKETEFSFRVEGTSRIKRAALMSSCVSSLEGGMFHVRTPPKEEPIPIIKFSLQPKLTPLPLRVRLVKRHTGTLLSVMIQYASNPELPNPLTNVTFILKLPVDPTLLKVAPKALLNREERELRWHVPDIPLKGMPGKLKARMPVEVDSGDGELEVFGMVRFAGQGAFTLSGVYLRPVSEGITHFSEDIHRYASGNYLCN
ncbi:uncharacterized protein M6B38_165210 [Iris pallida]|uniref:MHD domain-containing protein n=1 Tax=Iris pallida TaxID=29817 RepID=A0AAX6EWZ8_IRIPA|nr:uncharacterized protein M6B38_165210 [Iris pallida]